MTLTSGIGSLAGYNTGGSVPQVGGSGGSSGLMGNMTFEQFLEYIGRTDGGFLSNIRNDLLYKAYLESQGGNIGTKVLPDYLSINEDNRVVFAPSTTNSQFLSSLREMGVISEDDYSWLTQFFTPESGGNESWLVYNYGNPDAKINRESFFEGNSGLNQTNVGIMNRLFDAIDNASSAGGFVPPQTFINQYVPPVIPGQDFTGESVTRPVFIGQPPTGGEAEAPYYQASDVLVSSAEQPSLYDYNVNPETGLGQFDPYAPFETTDPYTEEVDLLYPYKPPPEVSVQPVPSTPEPTPIEFFVTPSTPVSTAPTTTPLTPTVPVATTPPSIVQGPPPGSTDVQGPPPGPTEENYVDPVQAALDYRPAMGEYARAPQYKDIDPLLHSRKTQISDLREFLRGSRQDVSMEDFLSALQQAEGRYGQGMTYDPNRGLFSNISEEELARHRENQAVPFFVNPDQMTDTEQVRAKMMGNRKLRGQQEVTIGDRMYFLDDGNVVSYQFRMPEMAYTPTFNQGGIVSVADQNADRVSGEGIESMLMTYKSPDVVSRERSAATLRRNLEKIASRPMAPGPVPTMQQGIMPMAG